MKVFYIEIEELDSDKLPGMIQCNCLKEDVKYTVIKAYIESGFCWFELKEDKGFMYDNRRFVPVSETDSGVKLVKKIINRKSQNRLNEILPHR